jgi:hypothetical protein
MQFIFYLVLRLVCLLIYMSHVEEPILEEEPHTLDDLVDDVGDLNEDKVKSHRSS